MKRLLIIITILLSGVYLFSSCKKVLTEKIYDFVSPANFYKTQADATAAINGVYSTLLSYGLYKQNFWAINDYDHDHASGPRWNLGSAGEGNPRDYWGIDNLWNDHYLMISRANGVIENVPGMTAISDDLKNRVLGEAYFWRGFCYFNLVRLYGGVPVKLGTISSGADPFTPRSSVKETYQQVLSDLKKAESLLFYVGDARSGDVGRVTKDAATAYLAKTYLTMASGSMTGVNISVNTGSPATWGSYSFAKDVVAGLEGLDSKLYFDSARIKCKQVIDGKRYSLFLNFMDAWEVAGRNKTEHMLMVNTFNRSDLSSGDYWAYFRAARPDGSNSGYVWATKNIYSNYEKTDHRALYGFSHQWKVFGSNFYFPEEDVEYTTDGAGATYIWNKDWDRAFTTKFSKASAGDNTVESANDVHYPILRFADVLLMHAEAENEVNGPTDAAYKSLNDVRVRSKATPAPAALSKDNFRSFVIEERGRELLYENNRRFDLVRWGIYLKVMNKMAVDAFDIVKTRVARNLLLPIPLSEINTNKELKGENNPGW